MSGVHAQCTISPNFFIIVQVMSLSNSCPNLAPLSQNVVPQKVPPTKFLEEQESNQQTTKRRQSKRQKHSPT